MNIKVSHTQHGSGITAASQTPLRHPTNKSLTSIAILGLFAMSSLAQSAEQAHTAVGSASGALNIKFEELKWEKVFPEFGDGSPQIAFLRVDPKTKATQLTIQVPKGFHVPKHWHTANETHRPSLTAPFVVECEGKRERLGPGSFNYMPSKLIHEG